MRPAVLGAACLVLLAAAPAVAGARQHQVKAGEILGAIAQRYGCSVAELKVANQLPSDLINIGDTLEIPACTGAKGRAHTVVAGEYLAVIAAGYGCTVDEVKQANRLQSDLINIGDVLRIPLCAGEPTPRATKRSKKRGKSKGKKRRAPRLGKHRLDTQRLADLMARRGFRAPGDFKALVVEYTLDRGQRRVVRERPFDWRGTSDDSNDWNPASTIKFFAAVGALEVLNARGFSPSAVAEFHDHGGKKKRKYRVDELVTDALVKSDNIAYNRLVQLAGYDRLNGVLLGKRRGMSGSGIHKPYERGRWVPMTGLTTFRETPKILIRQGKRVRTVHARESKKEYTCKYSGACTSLQDLAENMRRLMLHEQIPTGERHRIGLRELRVIRKGLEKKRKRGMEFVRAIEKAFKPGEIHIYHKPGFAGEWYSDCLYIYKHRSRRRWIVAAAGHPGRGSLTSAGRVIGEILANEEL